MSEDSDYGFMIWDGKSRGTKTNVINLTEQSKTVLLFYSPWKDFFVFKNPESFEKFMNSISQDDKTLAQPTEISLFDFA